MAISNLHQFSNYLAVDFGALRSKFIKYFSCFEPFSYQNRWHLMIFIKIYQIMARKSKNIGSIKAISANFDFSPNPASRLVGGWIVRVQSDSVRFLLKIPNGLVKILIKTPSKVRGEGGNNRDIHLKKVSQIVIFRGVKLQKK